MKELINDIKRSRFPKEVLILIDILNNDYLFYGYEHIEHNVNSNNKYLFSVYITDGLNIISPYYYNIHDFLKVPDDMLSSERFMLYKNYTKIAIQNSNYSEHYLL